MLTGLRDKMFFFYTHEMWENKEPQGARTSTMPTALERQGDFSQTLDTNGRLIFIRDPLRSGRVQRDHRRAWLLSRQHHSRRPVRLRSAARC